MKFFTITADKNQTTNKLFREACKKREVGLIEVDHQVSFEKLPKLKTQDALYRVSTSKRAKIIEQLLIQPKTKTFYKNNFTAYSRLDNVIEASIWHQKIGLPLPKTIFGLPTDKSSLKQAAEKLGLPLIIKATGQSHGIGVIKVDSLSSLYSIADYLRDTSGQYILRQFIETDFSARLIVLGDQVIDSIAYLTAEEEFRSNEGQSPIVKAKKFDIDLEKIALKSVQVLNLEFGGVDIIVKNDQPYLLEVNMPCFFGRAQLCTGTDIASQMIAHLKHKAQSS